MLTQTQWVHIVTQFDQIAERQKTILGRLSFLVGVVLGIFLTILGYLIHLLTQ